MKKESTVTVRVPPALHDALIKKAAAQTDGNVSELLRSLMAQSTGKPPPRE